MTVPDALSWAAVLGLYAWFIWRYWDEAGRLDTLGTLLVGAALAYASEGNAAACIRTMIAGVVLIGLARRAQLRAQLRPYE